MNVLAGGLFEVLQVFHLVMDELQIVLVFHEGIGPDGIHVLRERAQVDAGVVAVGADIVIPADVDVRLEGLRSGAGHPVEVVH